MTYARVNMKVITDNTGIITMIPGILTEDGPLWPLIRYQLDRRLSRSSAAKLVQAVSLLMDYTAANHNCFESPRELFKGFTERLYTGTIGDDGLDPSGLYWLDKSRANAKQLLGVLIQFFDWMQQEGYIKETPNPWREATKHEQRLFWAAYAHRHNNAFLGHAWSRKSASEASKQARALLQPTKLVHNQQVVKHFPEDRILDLLTQGFIRPGKQKSPHIHERLNTRDILITILMHGGGLRLSEPFHLYVEDVMEDPNKPGVALVRVYHPEAGRPPSDGRDLKGKAISVKTREGYLRTTWGMPPRTKAEGNQWVGWKNPMLHRDGNYMQVFWFPDVWGRLFWQLWKIYRMEVISLGRKLTHPFAFISFGRDNFGQPYTTKSYEQAHERAVKRIGLVPAEIYGTNRHGHRHAYAQRLTDARVPPKIIQHALHHKSIESQGVYTKADLERTVLELTAAQARMESGPQAFPMINRHGLEGTEVLEVLQNEANPTCRLIRTKR